jgi:SAM-dependent methyltransferase
LRQDFRCNPEYSHNDFAQIPLGDQNFDLIWVGSLLTHLDARRGNSFVEIFSRRLRPGGLLIFSSHGRLSYQWIVEGKHKYGLSNEQSARVLDDFERVGFGFINDTDAPSDGVKYGLSFCSPNWVLDRIIRLPEIRLVHLAEAAWDHHQDIFACVREPH